MKVNRETFIEFMDDCYDRSNRSYISWLIWGDDGVFLSDEEVVDFDKMPNLLSSTLLPKYKIWLRNNRKQKLDRINGR